jgi:formylglycine-generating enzyme required for sulfatase activity
MEVRRDRLNLVVLSVALTAVSLTGFCGSIVRAQDASWLQRRAGDYKAWRLAHPHPDKEIVTLKAGTAAAVKKAISQAPSDLSAPPAIWKIQGGITELFDCEQCPAMEIVPAGSFTMGSPASEAGRDTNESPMHRVTITAPFAVAKFDVTRAEFAQFETATGYNAKGKCFSRDETDQGSMSEKYNWESPGFTQKDSEPVVCINRYDAEAYAAWLSKVSGKNYRLLSEAEWEFAARSGTTGSHWWGESPARLKMDTNDPKTPIDTHPVNATLPNPFGLYGMLGTVWQWTEDCWHDNYGGAPTDGKPWMDESCTVGVMRGGSTASFDSSLRSAARHRFAFDGRFHNYGFRVARTL